MPNFATMPMLLLNHPFEGAVFAVWQITEAISFFEGDIELSSEEKSDYEHYSGARKLEWMASRWLLHRISGLEVRMVIDKDEFSKPFFSDHADYSCSLSHSHGVVAALLVKGTPLYLGSVNGCDIQILVPKIKNIASKFINEPEFKLIENLEPDPYFDLLHILWTSKESMYKAYGMKLLDFKKNMHVTAFSWNGLIGEATGKVEKGNYTKVFNLQFAKIQIPNTDTQLIWNVTHATTSVC